MSRRAGYAIAAIVAAVASFGAAAVRPNAESETAAFDGASLFGAKGCATCHDGPDGQSLTDAGPSLAAAATWAGDRIEGVSAASYIEQSMRSPAAFISPAYLSSGGWGVGMPLLQLSDDEIAGLVDYLLTR